jgi:hypothetical protein
VADFQQLPSAVRRKSEGCKWQGSKKKICAFTTLLLPVGQSVALGCRQRSVFLGGGDLLQTDAAAPAASWLLDPWKVATGSWVFVYMRECHMLDPSAEAASTSLHFPDKLRLEGL